MKVRTNTLRLNTRGPAESWRDLFDYFNIDYFKIVLKFQVFQVDSALTLSLILIILKLF